MLDVPIWLVLTCGTVVSCLFGVLALYMLRKSHVHTTLLVAAVQDFGRIVELATSDRTNAAMIAALTDRVEASEQRSRTALAQTSAAFTDRVEACEQRSQTVFAQNSDAVAQIDRIEDRLKSHIGREMRQGSLQKAEDEQSVEDQELADMIAAVQAVPVQSDEPQPTNRRRRRRKRRQRHRGA